MLKTEAVTIDDIRFETTQFPAMRAFELLARLVKSVGPAIGALTNIDPNTELSSIGPQLMAGLSTLNPSEAAKLVEDVLACTTADVDNKRISLSTKSNIDLVFSSKLKTMFKVLGHALKVNYQDFNEGSDPAAPLTQNQSAG
jgi:hypothetical protein